MHRAGSFLILIMILVGGLGVKPCRGEKPFEPTIESLKQYECPQWFRDAKFGIYIHWGVYSVAEQGEWYARRLYEENRKDYAHHVKTWGHPSKFGYKDFVPMWKAEKFDANEMVGLFKQAGAKYFTPCAVHHDGFDLWDSKHHRWNAVDMGPKKDIIGMFRRASQKHGLHFGVTTHLARSYSWMQPSHGSDSEGPLKGVPYDGADPDYQDFYHPPHDDWTSRDTLNPPKAWREVWYKRMVDLIDNYQPELVYLDSGIPFMGDDEAKTGMRLMAYYYNQCAAANDGKQQCVFTIKNRGKGRTLYVEGVATLDLERSKADRLYELPWQTDDSIGPWGYRAGAEYKTVNCVIDKLIDIVSKNGNLLLNVPPRADGTLDAETIAILKGTGQWLKLNGEAIYGTRPWVMYGEGPTEEMHHLANTSPYTAQDIRYTKKGSVLYVLLLDWPGDGETVEIKTLGSSNESAGKLTFVSLLGSGESLTWKQTDESLTVTLPTEKPCQHAFVLKLR